MAIREKRKELQRLQHSFEIEADKYHDLRMSVLYFTQQSMSEDRKFKQPSYMISLWQYYGKASSDEEINKLMKDLQSHTKFGVPGAEFSAFCVLEGEKLELFMKMANRAATLFSKKEVDEIIARIKTEVVENEGDGKPVFITNSAPLSVWLNYVLYHSSISHPKRFPVTHVHIDPFTSSLRAIEDLLENPDITKRKNLFRSIDSIKFKVSLSFPGEKREYVHDVAQILKHKLGDDKVFYDLDYQAQLARPNIDILLQKIYHDNSELVIVFLCKEYDEKEWCGIEWRAIRDLIKKRHGEDIMFMRFDNSEIQGVFSIDGYVDLKALSTNEAADLIFERLKVLEADNVDA